MQLGRIHVAPTWRIWRKGWFWVEPQDTPLFSDMVDENANPEPPFAAVRAGGNRIERIARMLQMGFMSPNEARAILGFI